MHNTDCKCKNHLFVVCRAKKFHITGNDETLEFLGNIRANEADSEECTQKSTNHGGENTECDYKIHHSCHILAHLLLEQEAQQNEDESVTGVAHTECKEQREEGSHDGSRVEIRTAGHSIHLCKYLVHARECIVLQFHRSIVAALGCAHLIKSTAAIEERLCIGNAILGHPALEKYKLLIREFLAIEHHLREFYILLNLLAISTQQRNILLGATLEHVSDGNYIRRNLLVLSFQLTQRRG